MALQALAPVRVWSVVPPPAASRPEAVAIVCELFHHAALYRATLDVRAAGLPESRVAYVSTLLRDSALLAGDVIHPPAGLAPLLTVERLPGRRRASQCASWAGPAWTDRLRHRP